MYNQRGGGSGRISQMEGAWVVQREGEGFFKIIQMSRLSLKENAKNKRTSMEQHCKSPRQGF